MAKINLLPREDFERRALGKFLKWILSYGRYIIIVVELVVFLVFFSRFIYDQKLSDLNERIEQKQAIVASAAAFENKIRTIHKRIEQVKTLDQERTIYLKVLDTLKLIVPVDMVLTSLDFKEEKITISGETEKNESFAKLITTLKSDPLFEEISVESVDKVEPEQSRQSEETVIEFTIQAVVAGYKKEPSPTPVAPAPATAGEDTE
jgi:Tfp pilus assembly protein PilN